MKRYVLFILFVLVCLSSSAMGPKARSLTEEKNYLLSIYPISEVTSTENLTTEEVTYYDGIGRPVEEIHRGLGVSYNDIATFHQYDALVRGPSHMLPPVVTCTGAYGDINTYRNKVTSLYDDTVLCPTTESESNLHSHTLPVMESGEKLADTNKKVKYHVKHRCLTRMVN